MSESPDDDTKDSGRLPAPLRSVTPGTRSRPNEGMDVIGWGMLAGLFVLLMPLLPFIIIVWGISKVTEMLTPSS
ncbi:hypothetical protein HISP_01100 [Haloarcula hispanica N601]|uniref:Uncharacterized protein n=3 Tax=Haloarcula hispanica TaxID=51589 RepID=A0A482T3C5_HALHI|nr:MULTISPECIES: hypothetical protein [Haloarcula]AEM55836.1 conserved hypothetical protein [Haloarcula hispanica ATCC 33960]AHB64663.1 hypothetical protein HISP_01100 [Haloarcula hispanica N601]AJF25846.1 hypothetical protein SG26_08945 [Haloarcula sp. CBA1115]KAA9405517.1 hypothetical protein Har1131_01350 [Haloarcula sp. CBA1131]KAA9408602.1 hypothetical protein EGO51_01955 [Haloarcula hispanica]